MTSSHPYQRTVSLWQKQRGQQKVGGWLSQIRLYQALRYHHQFTKSRDETGRSRTRRKRNLLAIIEQVGGLTSSWFGGLTRSGHFVCL